MIIARKANRQYIIDKSQESNYVALGYDIYENGQIIRHGAGKTISYAKHEATEKAIGKARQDLEAANKEIERLNKELEKVNKALRATKKK